MVSELPATSADLPTTATTPTTSRSYLLNFTAITTGNITTTTDNISTEGSETTAQIFLGMTSLHSITMTSSPADSKIATGNSNLFQHCE